MCDPSCVCPVHQFQRGRTVCWRIGRGSCDDNKHACVGLSWDAGPVHENNALLLSHMVVTRLQAHPP